MRKKSKIMFSFLKYISLNIILISLIKTVKERFLSTILKLFNISKKNCLFFKLNRNGSKTLNSEYKLIKELNLVYKIKNSKSLNPYQQNING